MLIYFDVSCLNRPFDDQRQARVRLESSAVEMIFARIDIGIWRQVASEIALIEIDAMPDLSRRARVRVLLPRAHFIRRFTKEDFTRAAEIEKLGFKPADAMHLAAAESARADVLLTCDDRLERRARRHRRAIRVAVANPLSWITEHDTDADS